MLEGKTAVVVGASRGLGRGVAESLSAAGASALGLEAVREYAARRGVSEGQFRQTLGAPVTPEIAGEALAGLAAGRLDNGVAYALTGDGLSALTT